MCAVYQYVPVPEPCIQGNVKINVLVELGSNYPFVQCRLTPFIPLQNALLLPRAPNTTPGKGESSSVGKPVKQQGEGRTKPGQGLGVSMSPQEFVIAGLNCDM